MRKLITLTFLLVIHHSSLVICQNTSPWQIVATDINPAKYFGVTVANGMVGIVSSPQPMQVQDVVLNGVYDYYQRGRVSNILKSFNHVNMYLDVDKRRIGRADIQNYAQTLDMKKAALITTFDVGDKISVKHTVMSLRHLPFTALVDVEITAKKDCEITPASVIEAPTHLNDIRNIYAEIDRPHVTIPLMSSVAKSPTGKVTVAASNSFLFDETHGQEPRLIHEDWDNNMHLLKFYKNLKAGQKYHFAVAASAISSVHNEFPLNEAERLTIFAKLEGRNKLVKYHEAEWEKLWQSDIQIEGDLQAQKDVRFALYHLYSFVREGSRLSLSPMGLSGLGYNGHVFWDTELWMYPPLLMLQPNIARSILDYRFDRLEMAKRNAYEHGYKGAMFPWESAESGGEDTPVWALTGPFQHHITGCIGWATWKYYQVTKDKQWLREKGYPLLKEAAAFWCSRVERNGPGQYDIKNVIGANEWQENIDNNAFTNGMAKTVLLNAVQAATELGLTPNPDWKLVSDNIPILKFPDGTTKENATYDGVTIKQADVNLLAYPLKIVSDDANIRKDMAYYEPRYSPEGPAMGVAILSTLWSRLGEPEKAYTYFQKGYVPNKVPPFGVISEAAGGTNPYFATGAGGMLQSVVSGFGGLDITENGIIQLKTKLPKAWKSLKMTGVGVEKKAFEVR
jgi:protein-glucosylgalactosylhydroxylysine glucosidase